MIELPWYPKELTPNFKRRNHWRKYQKPTLQYRTDCGWLTKKYLLSEGLAVAPAGLRIQSITFYPPDKRKRDDDGMIGAFKAGRDGVADALGIDDHTFRPGYNFGLPVKGGKIVVTLA